jgi:cytochrome P450
MPLQVLPSSDVDLFSDEVLTNPYPQYRVLRDAGPAVFLSQLDMVALPRYAQVRAALLGWRTFSSADGVGFNDAANQLMGGNVLSKDPPEHDRLRAELVDRLSPRAIRPFAARIEAEAERLVAELVQRREFDGVADLARVFPSLVVTDLIGLTQEVRDNLIEWGDASFCCVGPLNARTEEAFSIVEQLFSVLASLTKDDLAPGSMGRSVFEAAERGDIDDDDVLQLLWDYTGPGIDTTISALSTLLWQFAQNPAQWDLVRADPALVPAACNEALRYDAPAQLFTRVARADWDADGTTIEAGQRVVVMYGSANRDERHYDDPDRFDIRRAPSDHLAFGFGIHSCVGANLARLEMHTLVSVLARRVSRIEAAGEPKRHLNNIVRGLASLPVTMS